jgi:formiminoglutamase
MTWRPTDPQLFFSRQDQSDPRLGEMVRPITDASDVNGPRAFVVGGYPDDEGIRLNGGRPGAALAPSAIRRSLYKMTPPLQEVADFSLFDFGDLAADGDLGARHAAGAAACNAVLSKGGRWIGLGGGHDYGFAEASGFLTWAKATSSTVRPLVINFDAHFDVRPATNGFSSGTPFFRMLESGAEMDFAEIGIQSQCNSKHHLKWLKDRNARVLTMEDVEASGETPETCAVRLLGDWIIRPRPTFLSIDIDAFSSAVAPGCSQSWATGLMPADFFPLFDMLVRRMDVRALGVYETSPPLDQDDRTSKLAALIAHRFISRGGRT